MKEPLQIFCCYAREDRPLFDKLRKHLQALEYDRLITIQADVNIAPGNEWENEISNHLNTAQVILLLVSPNFMASRYCYKIEMRRAIERHELGETRVIPLLLREVDWQHTPLGKLQALPSNAKFIGRWRTQDTGFADIAQGVRQVVEGLRQGIIPISHDVLMILNKYKDTCQQQNNPFLTFHTLLALLENHDSRTRYHLDCLTPPCATRIQKTFQHYVNEILPREKLPFSNFRWEVRSEVQEALQIAREEGSSEVTGELLLMGVLNTQSTSETVQLLGKLIGKDNFQELSKRVRLSLKRSRRSPQLGTPNINEKDVLSIYYDE